MKNIYLTVTAGRTGTGFLQKLFELFEDFTSVHEPSIPNGDFWADRFDYINSLSTTNYIETSHLICKGWIEPLLDKGIVPNLIVLKRKPREIAKSLLTLKTVPFRTSLGNKFLIPANNYFFLKLPKTDVFNDYQLCFWYCLEIEKRQVFYGSLIERMGGKAFETSIAQLQEVSHINQMISFFNLSFKANGYTEYQSLCSNPINQKLDKKRVFNWSDSSLEIYEREVMSFIQ